MLLQILLVTVGILVGVVGTSCKVMYDSVRQRMDAHDKLDDTRFNRMEDSSEKRHGENIVKFNELSRGQHHMSGALIVALSTSATPEERRDIIKDLRESV